MHEKLYEGFLMSNPDTVKAAIAAGADINEPYSHRSGKTPSLEFSTQTTTIFFMNKPQWMTATSSSRVPERTGTRER